MKQTTPTLNKVWSRALRAVLMILPLGLSGCFDDKLPPAGSFDLAVSVSGSGQVTSNPAGIDCGSDCVETLAAGSSITLNATPASGAMFTGWGGDCSGSTPSCTLTMNAGRAVTASFTFSTDPPPPAAQYTLSVSVTGTGSVSSTPAGISCGTDCTENYTDGTSVTLTATPGANQQFSGWTNACTGTQLTCTVSMSAARSVTASFTPVLRALTVTLNGTGSVASAPAGINCGTDCSENYAHGSNVTLTATPGANQQFSGWLGACSGTTTTCTVAMTEARSVTATFAPLPAAQFTLTVSVTGSGTVTSSPAGISCGSDCTESYASSTSVTLTATAENGFQFSSWGGACSGSGACVVAMNMNQAVTATFRSSSVDLNCTSTWAGSEETTTITAWPYRDCFRSNPVGTRTRMTNNVGAEVVWDEGAGWNGQNALRVRPPHILTRDSVGNRINGQGYAGLGEHHFHAVRTKRLNIRYLFRYNSNWAQYAQNTKWEIAIKYNYPNSSPPQRREGCERAMAIGVPGSLGVTRKALIVEQGVCTQSWNVPNLNGWYFGPGLRENEWVSVESEFDIDTGLYSTYITTQDGVYNQSLHTQINIAQGQYGAPPETERDPYWWGSIDCTAGCFWGWPDDGGSIPRPDDTYIWYSHVVISNTRIGPPAGFIRQTN